MQYVLYILDLSYVCTFLYTGKQTPYSPLTLQVPKLDNKSKWLSLHALPPFTCIVPPCILQSRSPNSTRQLQGYCEICEFAAKPDTSSLLDTPAFNYFLSNIICASHHVKIVCRRKLLANHNPIVTLEQCRKLFMELEVLISGFKQYSNRKHKKQVKPASYLFFNYKWECLELSYD